VKYAKILIEKGLAYPDPYSEEEISQFRKQADEEKRAFLYRDHRPETFGVWDGTKPLRFKVPEIKNYTWNDAVRGELTAGPEALDDFILIKSDGYPTYNFAHIIDDLEMGVTHIMRADEFIASTPKFLSLYEALEITPPVLVTLPPILAPDGNKKLGKRDGAKDILEYRNEGYLPEAMINFLAFLGWNPGGDKEVMTPEEIVQSFSIERIHKAGAMLSEDKLLWLNKEHIKRQTLDEQYATVAKILPDYPEVLLKKLTSTIVDRISYYNEIKDIEEQELSFFVRIPKYDSEFLSKVAWKETGLHEAKKHLEAIVEILKSADFSSAESVKQSVMVYADEHGRGNVLWPLRMSLSGKEKSVDPFTICYVLGKEESIARVIKVCEMITA
jgi:glutamyl-tRNA synthetase